MAIVIAASGGFDSEEKRAAACLAQYRNEHEAFRTMLSRGRFKVTLELCGSFCIIVTNLKLRGGKGAFLECLPKKPANSLLVSLTDKTHNARAIVDDLTEDGQVV